jgi:hypothetical protein
VTRAHLHLPLINSSGTVFPYALVTLNDASGIPLDVDVFVQSSGGNPIAFPLFVDPAVIDVWMDVPSRVQIIAEVSDNVRIVLDGVDLMPPPDQIAQTHAPIMITDADTTVYQGVLMSSLPGEAVFRVTDPVGTHQHVGDSAGSVVLTGEAPTDFNPYQSWVGYHAGENAAANSAGSSALGEQADVYGASATILGVGQIAAQLSTGTPGDFATVLSSESGDATGNSTTLGAANLTKQGRDMTVVGSLNGPSGSMSVPNGSTVVGPGNVIGASGALKIGANHPTSSAGSNHTTIGVANIAQQNGLPWAGSQIPIALGANKTLAGDPSDVVSATDWFGGVGPLAAGTNSTAFSPSLLNIGGTLATQVALKVVGDVIVNGHRTHSGTSTTLGFFGATGTTRPQVAIDPGDVSNTMLTSLLAYLSKIGLIYTVATPVLTESGTHPNGTALEFAETGQALQWKLPPTSTDYRAANAFTVASNTVVLNAALAPFPTHGLPALYSCGRADVTVQGRFGYSAATSSYPDSDLYTGLMVRSYLAQSIVSGQPVAVPTGILVGRSAVYSVAGNTIGSTLATLSTKPAAGDLLQADCSGTSVTIRVNGSSVATFTDSTFNARVKHGYRLMSGTSAWAFQVSPFGF